MIPVKIGCYMLQAGLRYANAHATAASAIILFLLCYVNAYSYLAKVLAVSNNSDILYY